MRIATCLIAIAVFDAPALAGAQDPATPSPTDERRLTPAQVEAILADAEKKNSKPSAQLAPIDEVDVEPPPPPIHGEFGIGVGTGDYREIYGTGIYPLGNNGAAIFNFDLVDWGKHRGPPW